MRGTEFAELTAFVEVAEQRNFAKAAAQLGIAPSTLSQTIRSLEERLGVRLLNRTTRSVAPTEAGERLLTQLRPALDNVGRAIEEVNAFRDKPMGTLRLLVGRPIALALIEPLFAPFLEAYPEISLDVVSDDSRADLVEGRFDAGLRIGERIERDMIAVRIVPGIRMACVAAPRYLARQAAPRAPHDLRAHECVRFRTQWDGAVHPWAFHQNGEPFELEVHGRVIVNDLALVLRAAAAGAGIGYTSRVMAAPYVSDGRLVSLLEDWCPTLSGVYIYYPSRRQVPAPLEAFVAFARKRAYPPV
ncbi:MAG TPA: LysR family transcriptional regulator [Xanthobacteraceae bacterium]|nr:LysR family transcriptional regulator [Xanthobacteraceae bacterium]